MATIQLTNVAPTSNRPGVFYEPISAPANQQAAPTDVVAIIGEFSRGLTDAPQWVGQPNDAVLQFGPVTAHPTVPGTNLNGMMSVLKVGKQGILDKYVVRVGSSLMKAGYVTLLDGAGNSVLSLHAASAGTWSNGVLSYAVTAGTGNAWNLTVTNLSTGEVDTWLALPGGTAANILLAITQINARNSALAQATLPVIDTPSTAPTVTATGTDGTIPAGTAYVQVAFTTTAGGETQPSPEQTVTVSSTNHLAISVASLPTGTNGIKAYVSTRAGGEQFAASAAATSVNVLALPAATAQLPLHGQVTPNMPTPRTAATTAGTTSTWIVNPISATFPATSPATGQGIGNDGASAPTSRYTGWLGAPNVGAATLLSQKPHPDQVLYAEGAGADTAEWLAQAQNAQAGNWCANVCLPQGTAPGAAPALVAAQVATLGVYADFIKVAWNWGKVPDPAGTGAIMLTAPHGYLAAVTAQQLYNTAAFNKSLVGLVGVEFPATDLQLQANVTANINSLIKDIPAGDGLYGFDNDRTVSGMDAFEMRTRAFFADAISAVTGDLPGNPNDPRQRQMARSRVSGIFDREAGLGRIPGNPQNASVVTPPSTLVPATQTARGATNAGTQPSTVQSSAPSAPQPLGYVVICDSSNNVNAGTGVAAPILYITVMAAIFSNIRQVWTQAQIGQTVVVSLVGLPTS